MFDPDKRISFEWNVNCPIDAKNNYAELHEVYTAIYKISKNYELHVFDCEFCNYYAEKEVKK